MIQHKDYHDYENKYGGIRFNDQIGKHLLIEEWSHNNLAYVENILSGYIVSTNVSAFVGTKYGAQCLNYNLHHPTMHHHDAYIYQTNLPWCKYGTDKLDDQTICNELEVFVDAEHTHKFADCRSIYCILFTFTAVVFHRKVGKQTCISTHSINSDFFALHIRTKIS